MASHTLHTDTDLFSRIADGSEQALSALIRDHHAVILSFALKLTRNQQLAEEVVQDVFLNIWLHRAKLTEVRNAGAYLNRMTRNVSLNALRKVAKDAIIAGEFKDDENYSDDSTQQALDLKDSEWLVQQAIDKLPRQQKLVYQLCHQQGLTYDQAAAALQISSSTVNFHMKEALKHIRKSLRDMGIPAVLLALLHGS